VGGFDLAEQPFHYSSLLDGWQGTLHAAAGLGIIVPERPVADEAALVWQARSDSVAREETSRIQ